MVGQEVLDPLRLMSGKVVEDHMDLLSLGLACDQIAQEGDELLAGVAIRRATENGPRLGVQSRVQRQRAVAVVLKPMTLQASRRQRQHRVEPVQGLNRGLLVDAKN